MGRRSVRNEFVMNASWIEAQNDEDCSPGTG
jgi:hypothetical protein